VLDGIEGEEGARTTEHVTGLEITARVHDYVTAWPEGSSYLGFAFARASNPTSAEKALREAHRKLHFAITRRLPVEHPVTRTVPPGEHG